LAKQTPTSGPSRFVIAIETDFHANHRLGLCNPDVVLSDGDGGTYRPELTEVQKYLWDLRVENLGKLSAFMGKTPLIYLNIGDQTNGFKHPGNWVSTNPASQYTIARANMEPILKMKQLRAIRFIKGTEAHEGMESYASDELQLDYKLKYPQLDIKTVWHGVIDINGFVIDAAHHGPGPGSREWLRGNVARLYLQDRIMRELIAGNEAPQLYVRGHYHSQIWVTIHHPIDRGFITSDLILVPSMCGLGAYARQVVQSTRYLSNGMVVLRVEGKRIIETAWFTQTLDIAKKELLSV